MGVGRGGGGGESMGSNDPPPPRPQSEDTFKLTLFCRFYEYGGGQQFFKKKWSVFSSTYLWL